MIPGKSGKISVVERFQTQIRHFGTGIAVKESARDWGWYLLLSSRPKRPHTKLLAPLPVLFRVE
jgi:hypothetical protein